MITKIFIKQLKLNYDIDVNFLFLKTNKNKIILIEIFYFDDNNFFIQNVDFADNYIMKKIEKDHGYKTKEIKIHEIIFSEQMKNKFKLILEKAFKFIENIKKDGRDNRYIQKESPEFILKKYNEIYKILNEFSQMIL